MQGQSSKRWTTLKPYIDMVLYSFNRISLFGKDKIIGGELFLEEVWGRRALMLFWVTGILTCAPLQAAEAASPTVALLPWQLIGWDGEFAVRHRQVLASLHEELRALWLDQGQTLNRWVNDQGRTQSINEAHLSQSIWVGASRSQLGFDAYLIPILCPLGDSLVIALQLVDLRTQIILAGAQFLAPRGTWEGPRSAPPLEPIALVLKKLMQDVEVGAIRRHQPVPTDAMKLGLKLLRGSDTTRQGSLQCHNTMLAHSLIEQQRITASVGSLEASHLRTQMRINEAPQRATRTLAIDWGRYPEGPEKFPFDARWSEGILGASIDPSITGEVTLNRAMHRFEAPPVLVDLLRAEKNQLLLADLPQISRIDKAWVYLDRGRAYGLDLDDRLVVNDGQRDVKGHVVGFFGPNLGIVSPRGYPIHEGAIVYIRKGQKQVKLGDSLRFDTKTFPTPWPPRKTAP